MPSRLVIFVLILALGAATVPAQQEHRSAIMPESEAKQLIGEKLFAGRVAVSGTWAPAQSDIDALEASLDQVPTLSRKYSPGREINHPRSYFRQYLGLLEESRKLIYMSAFCGVNDHQAPSYWREHLFQISDGGSCVWQGLYDISAKKFVSISVNGYA